jgi:tetratricopeptide (TPR) repeat protein
VELATDGCPDEETVLAFIHGQLLSERRSLVEQHLGDCAACTDLATWAAADEAGSTHARAPEGWAVGSQLAPGARVGRYQILGAIGRGGMGEVYAAYHPDLDRRIALKVVYGERANDRRHQAQLLDEARIIARLDHPNIVTVYDAGVVDERVYVAMEFVDGHTLNAWLAERERALPEILDAFVAAGRGLAAAHDAKVVHRDFKPQNVMLGRDARVRVMDFGLARPLRELARAGDETSAASPTYATTSTTIGAFIGTPAYVAPEQLARGSVDVRADQYSFCVALHEAVYGERPGASEKTAQATAPRKSRARNPPPWLRAIVRRGLEHDREKRFDSMQDLLQAIDRGRNRVRRATLALGVGSTVLAVAAVAWRASVAHQFSCTPPRDRIAAVWSAYEAPGSRRATVHRIIAGSGLPDAEAIWGRVKSVLDDHVGQWAAMYKDTCEATHVRGDQSAEVLDLRMTCLSDNLDEIRAYTDALVSSGSEAAGHAIPTASALTPVRTCADVKNLRLQVPLPSDPRTRATVERLQQKIKDADALLAFKFADKAQSQLLTMVAEARVVGYKPVLAAALERLGMAQADLLQHRLASSTEREALVIAETARDDLTAARAADTLASLATLLAHTDEAEAWLSFAEAVLDRAGARGSLVGAWILNERGNLDYTAGNFTSSEAHDRAAIALKRNLLGETHPDVAISMSGLAQTLREMDRLDEARTVAREGIEILERLGDHDSLLFANELLIEAEILTKAHILEKAEGDLKRALRLERLNSATQGVLAAIALTDYGELLIARRQPMDAVGVLTRAQAIWEQSEIQNPIWMADTKIALAKALVDSKATRSHATDLAFQACRGYAQNKWFHKVRGIISWFNALPHTSAFVPITSCAEMRQKQHS